MSLIYTLYTHYQTYPPRFAPHTLYAQKKRYIVLRCTRLNKLDSREQFEDRFPSKKIPCRKDAGIRLVEYVGC